MNTAEGPTPTTCSILHNTRHPSVTPSTVVELHAAPFGEFFSSWSGGGGGWHKALVVGSVSLWRRLLASRP